MMTTNTHTRNENAAAQTTMVSISKTMGIFTKVTAFTLTCMIAFGCLAASAAPTTWTGTLDGTTWNDDANWSGTQPGQASTVNITTTDTITNVKRDAAGNNYNSNDSLGGIVNLNQGTINIDHQLHSEGNGIFNIGDGSGTADAVVNIISGGFWLFDRGTTTYTVNIKSDGQLNTTGTGELRTYQNSGNRHWEMNVMGGSVSNVNSWLITDIASSDPNTITLTLGGTVTSGSITVDEDIIDFADITDSSFEAAYGGSYANIAAVTLALGTDFTATGGGTLQAIDNGSTFTVSLSEFSATAPEPSTFVLAALGLLGLGVGRRRRERM